MSERKSLLYRSLEVRYDTEEKRFEEQAFRISGRGGGLSGNIRSAHRFWFPVACFIAGSVKAERFSARDWNEAVRYLTGENIRFASPVQAQKFLEVNKDNFHTDKKAGKRM